jgi:hypothetical protein
MPGDRNVIHTNDELQLGSHYLRYHIKMYVETLLWLQDHIDSIGWDTVRNAILEDHLVHARILINFLSNGNSRDRKDDVLAIDYFHGLNNVYYQLQDVFLTDQIKEIGGQLVHITKKSMPKLKSEKDWSIRDTASKLVPALQIFLNVVPETKLAGGVKNDCINYLARLIPPKIPVKLSAST